MRSIVSIIFNTKLLTDDFLSLLRYIFLRVLPPVPLLPAPLS